MDKVATYWLDERGARVFDVSGRRYRAFWSQSNRWCLTEIGMDGIKIAPVGKVCWDDQRNWPAVESFVAWRARLSGAEVSTLKVVPPKAARARQMREGA